jgi:hypothetical protein
VARERIADFRFFSFTWGGGFNPFLITFGANGGKAKLVLAYRLISLRRGPLMSLRALVALATLTMIVAPAAFAADMPAAPPPSVIYAPPPDAGLDCGPFGNRPVDRVWKPGQVAYIVAKSCGPNASWLRGYAIKRRENLLVYYNGGSWARPDVRIINVPYQPQLHH